MGSAISERVQLAKFCSSKDWSKAIRVLDSILSQSPSIQDICNRAFCYSQLELHKHVIKDCNKAIQLDPSLLQAYILKGVALSALGKKEDAVLVWEQGYEYALSQSADLKQLLELEELLSEAKHDRVDYNVNGSVDTSGPSLGESEAGAFTSSKSNDISTTGNNLNGKFEQSTKLGEKSGITCKLKNKIDTHDESQGKVDNNGKLDGHCNGAFNGQSNGTVTSQLNGSVSSQTNGKHTILHNLNGDSDLCTESTEICKKSPLVSKKSSNLSEQGGKSSGSSNAHNGFSAEAKSNKSSGSSDARNGFNAEAKSSKKFSVNRISKTKSISVDFRLSRGIAKVNEGKYDSAVSIFDQVLNEDPTYPEALIGRGTAYAFQRELDAAISDFTKAIQSNPSAGEAWKRRGQARAALGESAEAIADLTKALEFEPNSADILHERGIVNFKFKNFCAAFEDLSACVQLDKDNTSAYTYLGLALSSIGEYKRAEEAHMKSIQLDPDFLEGHTHLTQLYQDLANTEKALECIQQVLRIDSRFAKAYYLQALLLHGMGDHRNAIKALSLGLSIESSNIEFLYLRASCHHAIGEYKEAVKDYDATLDMELDSVEKFVLQCLAFYQKEIALYTASKFNIEFSWFDIDGDIDPFFKEYWCKRRHPKNVCEKVYRQPPLRESLRKGKLKKQDLPFTKTKMSLIHAADSIGKRIQYNCPGFLPNRRQHRMAGLAAIEIAQKVSKAWRRYINKSTFKNGKRARRKEKVNIASHNRGGAGCSTSTSLEAPTSNGINEDRSSGRFLMSWYDVYSLAVKWRQISEPCDPVVWVNKLSKEEFISGFGSHTPLILGQAKVVRYFPYFQRTLDVAKAIIMEKKHVYNKDNKIIDLSENERLQHIMKAESCADLYRLVGEDFWLVTGCISTATEGRCLEGTRITLVKVGEQGFDFAIKTPCTPFRWEEFDEEMTSAWEGLCNAYCGETYGSTDFTTLEEVRDAILRMAYYWFNFMPLSRGSASVGLVVLLGLFLAANMEFTGSIPQGFQVDWEAILNSDPNSFIDSVKSWLYPSLKLTTSWKDYPDVSTAFETTGSVVAALSTYNN